MSILAFINLSETNPYFVITPKDVAFTNPQGFPKPLYDFTNNPIKPEVFYLGRMLFYDPILSHDSSTSCSSCHQRIAAFGHIDHALSHGINGQIGNRNVPALQNLIWSSSYMWDGGITSLELQPIAPITHPREMGDTLAVVLDKLSRNRTYQILFKEAYHDTIINSQRMLKALTQFVGLMISNNSKYDQFLRNELELSSDEKEGLQVFRDKCAECHREPLFTDDSYKSSGLAPDSSLVDIGRGKITGVPYDFYRFKVPSLRNVEMTYPYMHDGRFRTLEQVIDHYSKGDFYPINVEPSLQMSKNISDLQKKQLVAFMKTLTDKTFLYDRRFADPTYR